MTFSLKDLLDKKKEQLVKEQVPTSVQKEAFAFIEKPLVASLQAAAVIPQKRSLKEILEEKKRLLAEAKERESLAYEEKEQAELAEEKRKSLPGRKETDVSIAEVKEEFSELLNEFPASQEKETFSINITLNERQLAAKEMALSGKNFVLTGAAGTGKTATQREIAKTLYESGLLKETYFRPQGHQDYFAAPSIAFCAYTRRASANLARAIHKDEILKDVFKYNIQTIHALLEFRPVFFFDDEKQKESMRFEPTRTAANPLTITHLVIEEASMLGLDLWNLLYDALPRGVQIIFIGDINQLQPVGKPSIMNYAITQLPVIELNKVYRQAEGSPIIENAHRILAGLMPLSSGEAFIPLEKNEDGSEKPEEIMPKGFSIMKGKKEIQLGQFKLALMFGQKIFKQWWEEGTYNPQTDIILSPWNVKDLGTENLNRWISQFLGVAREAIVYEVISGFSKLYLAVGDRVMVNKQDGVIKDIKRNAQYWGKETQPPSQYLSRFGVMTGVPKEDFNDEGEDDLDSILLSYSDFSLEDMMSEDKEKERKQQASHIIDVELDTGEIVVLNSSGDLAPATFSLGYALTVHKAQGCEWRKVFLFLHKEQAVSLNRELLYTAVTRARDEIVIIAKEDVIKKCITAQRLKGDSILEKIEFFNSKVDLVDSSISCVK